MKLTYCKNQVGINRGETETTRLKPKVLIEKRKRDLMMKDTEDNKNNHFRRKLLFESEYLDKLKADLEKEK